MQEQLENSGILSPREVEEYDAKVLDQITKKYSHVEVFFGNDEF